MIKGDANINIAKTTITIITDISSSITSYSTMLSHLINNIQHAKDTLLKKNEQLKNHFYNLKPAGVQVNKKGAFEMDSDQIPNNIYLLDEEELNELNLEEFKLILYFDDKSDLLKAKELLDHNFFEYVLVGDDHLYLRNSQTAPTIFRLLTKHNVNYEVGKKIKPITRSALGIDYDELEGKN